MADEGQDRELTAWEETTGSAQRSVQRSTGYPAPSTELMPIGDDDASRRRFAKALAPCLTLTAPAGMGKVERRDWFAAAFMALRHLPADAIERGAQVAQRTADHPSKIVPAIIAATREDMAWRYRMAGRRHPVALPSPGGERCTPAEAAEILERFGLRRRIDESNGAARVESAGENGNG